MKKRIEKEASVLLIKSMTKKAYKEHIKKVRKDPVPRPAVFADKRYQEKYGLKFSKEESV